MLFDRLVEFVIRLDEDSSWVLHDLDLPEDVFASALSLDSVIRGIKQEFESQLLAVDIVADMADTESGSLAEQWFTQASLHPNRQLNWHYSNYLSWIRMVRKIELIGTIDEARFEEIEPRLLERVFDFPNASMMSSGMSPDFFLSGLVTAKSRLVLFDQHLARHRSTPILDRTKNTGFGSHLDFIPMQNGTMICQRLPLMLKTLRPSCIPAASTRSP